MEEAEPLRSREPSPRGSPRVPTVKELRAKWLREVHSTARVPQPLRCPFEEIDNLEKILVIEDALEKKKRNLKPTEVELTLDDNMMSPEQYQKLYDFKYLD